jgi:uncharacterized protein YkwD
MRVRSALFSLLLFAACEGAQVSDVGSNTNWLEACHQDRDCTGTLSCRCGICTLDCNTATECEPLPGARCVPTDAPAAWSTCQSMEPGLTSGICLPGCEPGSCRANEACVSNTCVPVALPESEFCASAAGRSAADRASEEDLLARLQAVRVDGNAACGSAPPSASVPPLRLDSRLHCAARVLSIDLEESDNLGLVDSLGRNTQERMTLVGHANAPWGESYARSANASEALATMMLDADSCQRFVDATFLDIGVGVAGDVYVVTIGAE